MKKDIIISGFGGQGVMSIGKNLVEAGMAEGYYVTWAPSYGPEMRGGTANCSVTLSDEPIGSPLVTAPNALVAMNQPSFDKFIGTVRPGGVAVADSTMVPEVAAPEGVGACAIPATALAEEAGLKGLANIVLVGKLWALTGFCDRATLDAAIEASVPPRKAALIEKNKQAIALGIEA